MTVTIEKMTEKDWPQVRAIYLEGIATGNATFEQNAPSWEKWDSGHLSECRFVARVDGVVMGWVALTPVSSRCVYAGVADLSVYVSEAGRGQGIGSALMQTLIAASESQSIWTLQAGIFPENMASLALHRRHGFRDVGRREHIGQMRGIWRDVLFLERRSKVVGVS